MARVRWLSMAFVIGGCMGGGNGSPSGDVPGLSPVGAAGALAPGMDNTFGNVSAPTDPTLSGMAGVGGAAAPVAGAPASVAGAPAPVAGAEAPPPGGEPLPVEDPTAPVSPTDPNAPPPATPVAGGSSDPKIPPVTADCPAFRDGTISFMGLGGIQMVAGPKAPGPSAPMVFYWHGTGSFSGEFTGMAAAVHQGVVAEGGVLISFQGTTGGDLLSGTFVFGAGDFELVDQLVACAVRDHNVDPRRIYTTGCSAGGLFSAGLAASRSSYVAAAAPNSGGFTVPVAFQDAYTPALMTIHGAPGRDVVVVDFSVTSATADEAFKAHGGFVINCNHGGGHCGGGPLSPDVWEFFKAHPYGVDPYPWTAGLPPGFNSSCVIY